MGAAIYVSLEKSEGFNSSSVDGKALSRSLDSLDAICKSKRLKPLMEFCSMSSSDIGEELIGDMVIEQKWFSAKDGLKTVKGLLNHLSTKPLKSDNKSVIEDLEAVRDVLLYAQENKVKFCFKVDF